MTAHDVDADEWLTLVTKVIAQHPEYASITVQATQEGILAALDRKSERLVTVSLGLAEALNTKPNHVKRDHARIVRAVEASTFHPTSWSKKTIERENAG